MWQTTWGSRDGADTDDRVRMIRLPRYGSTSPDGRKSATFDHPLTHMREEQLPAYESHTTQHVRLMTVYHD